MVSKNLLDVTKILDICKPAIERGEKVKAELPIINVNRVVGTITGSEITKTRPERIAGRHRATQVQRRVPGSFGAFCLRRK